MSFEKSHVLGMGQLHEAIVTDEKQLITIGIEEMQADRVLGVQVGDNVKIFLLKKINTHAYQKKLIMTNPLGKQLLANLVCNFQSNPSLIQNINLSQSQSFQKCLQEKAVNHPDLLVEDIYGKDSSSIGLPEKLLASIFGKLGKMPQRKFEAKEVVRSYVMAIAINTAQITGLLAKRQQISDIIVLRNEFAGISFHRLVYVNISLKRKTLLKYYNPEVKFYIRSTLLKDKPQNK